MFPMFYRFAVAAHEVRSVELAYYRRPITEVPERQREYTSRRLLAILCGLVPPTE